MAHRPSPIRGIASFENFPNSWNAHSRAAEPRLKGWTWDISLFHFTIPFPNTEETAAWQHFHWHTTGDSDQAEERFPLHLPDSDSEKINKLFGVCVGSLQNGPQTHPSY